MADETLRIRVDVNTATLRELGGALKQVRSEMQTAAQSDLPALNAEAQALSGRMRDLTSRHSEFTQNVREARTEARTFRFALLELTHGLDGLASTFGTLTGAGDKAKEGFKFVTDGAKEALAAGLGLKFGLEAMGGSFAAFATPVALAVGGLTLLASGIAAVNKSFNDGIAEVENNRLEMLKLDEALAAVLRDMKIVSEEQYIDKMGASLDELTKRANEATKAVFSLNVIKSLTSGFAVFDVNEEKKTPIERQKEALAVAEAAKKVQAEIIKGSEVGAKAVDEEQRKRDEAVDADLNSYAEREKLFKQFLADQQKDQDTADAFNKADREENAKGFKRFLEDQTHDEMIVQGKAGTELSPDQQLGNWMLGVSALQSGFNALSASIHNGLAKAFGSATSMFQQFVIGVLDGIASIAESLASSAIIAGIFALFGGNFLSLFSGLSGLKFAGGGMVSEHVVGVGMSSGRRYDIGESGAEQVSPLTSFGGGGGGYNRIEIVGSTRIAGRNLLQSWKETRIIDRKSGGNV